MFASGRKIGRPVARWLKRVGPVVAGLTMIVWWLLVWRALPIPLGDQGTFVSVAERLLAGDTLYTEVAENKDPLFHYLNAGVRWLGPWGTWLYSLGLLVVGSVSAYVISRSLGQSERASVLVGWVASPVIMTGSMFSGGTGSSSHIR